MSFGGEESYKTPVSKVREVSAHVRLPVAISTDELLCTLFLDLFKEVRRVLSANTTKLEGTPSLKALSPSREESVLIELWLAALRAFPVILGPQAKAVLADSTIVDLLYLSSLECSSLESFTSVQILEKQLKEANHLLYDAQSGGCGTEVVQTAIQDEGDDNLAEELAQKAKEEQRRFSAQELASSLGQDLALCIKALELNDDQMERAASWLFSDAAFAFMMDPSGNSKSGEDDSNDTAEAARWKKADELVLLCQQPLKLCYRALEMYNDEIEPAATWLIEEGQTYLKLMMAEEQGEIEISDVQGENPALGIQSGFVADSQMTASSTYGPEYRAE